jgi:hypothetical protein
MVSASVLQRDGRLPDVQLGYATSTALAFDNSLHRLWSDKEANWFPAPDGHFSLYIRAYWGKQGILDGSWKPPVIRKFV